MKKAILAISIFSAALLLAQEMVKNGNFEQGLNQWFSAQQSGGSKVIHHISTDTKYGKKALKTRKNDENKLLFAFFYRCEKRRCK